MNVVWLRAGHTGKHWGHRTKLGIVWLIPFKYKKNLFYYEGGQTLTQVAQRGYGASIPGGIQNPRGHGPEQPGLLDPAWARGLDWRHPESLPTSAVLRVCEA